MNVELPQTRPYAALFVVGTRLSTGNALETIGAAIVKAAYRLNPSGGGDTHAMADDPNAAASALVLADQGTLFADPDDGMDVTREADIAPFKPLADIVVEGFLSGNLNTNGADVLVDNVQWLNRVRNNDASGLEAPSAADRGRHLFGYQPRTEDPRQNDAAADPTDTPKTLPAFDHYDNRFLNFHRRGGGFSASGAIAAQLDNGDRIRVRKAGADVFSVTLAIPRLSAMYRTWCGHGPDKAPYWTRTPIGEMHADTLILRPNAGSAEVIWRAHWPWNAEPQDRYRAIRVTEGGP